MTAGIKFEVETQRVLQILAREIYDSPLALLRENVQNAYDAIRMRVFQDGGKLEDGRIIIDLSGNMLTMSDNGIGMTEEQLRENFWKAGSSGKNNDEARKAGVVGTFGIGAMANFGVCQSLVVETQALGTRDLLRSRAVRSELRIHEECIALERLDGDGASGTKIIAELDHAAQITPDKARDYLLPYVRFLPVAVLLNDQLISGQSFDGLVAGMGQHRSFSHLGGGTFRSGIFEAECTVSADSNGQVCIVVRNIKAGGAPTSGELYLLQAGGQLMGMRSKFGLAPIPVSGHFQLGGYANLDFLKPTAGREAVDRQCIEQVSKIINLAEEAASTMLADTDHADRNNAFMLWLLSNARISLAKKVKIKAFPDEKDFELGEVKERFKPRKIYSYAGNDGALIKMFAGENVVLQVGLSHPRRTLQQKYLSEISRFESLPDSARITKIYRPEDCSVAEAAILLKIGSILRDDYLLVNVDAQLTEISHGVALLAEKTGETLRISVSRRSSIIQPLLECYEKAWDVFGSFMKDFVRVQIYPKIKSHVPSSTRDGAEALRRNLERNRELYRYEEAEFGDLQELLGDYLSGKMGLPEVMKAAKHVSAARGQSQTVAREHVGTVEAVVPDVVQSPVLVAQVVQAENSFEARPPIVRDDVVTELKVLKTDASYPQLNGFKMLLGLSDRVIKVHGDFFRAPHTTRVIWGGHRVVYIFTEASGRYSLYYDIELRDSISASSASGGSVMTTTVITKRRTFVPVPVELNSCFEITSGAKEFLVRFDILSSG